MARIGGLKRFGRNFGRGFAKGLKMSGNILQKGARLGRSILGSIDKFSGGAGTKFLMSTPEGQAALVGGNILANQPTIQY